MPILRLKLFGHPVVEIAGEEVTGFHSNKARSLLFYLAVIGRPQARTVLAAIFWGSFPEDRAMSNLRKTLSNLNQLVGEHLNIERDRVAFDSSSDHWLDVAAFQERLAEMKTGGGRQAAKAAVSLYVGEFLEGFYLDDAPEWEQWSLVERQRFHDGYLKALLYLAHDAAETGNYGRAIEYARTALIQEPLQEGTHQFLMSLYARNGQRALALRQYDTCRQILFDELGISPSEETTALSEAIRTGEFSSTVPLQPQAAARLEEAAGSVAPDFLNPGSSPSEGDRTVFVDREAELARLDEYLKSTLSGEGRAIFITGEAGQGKSALLNEFSRRAQERIPELIVASGACNAFSGSGDPFHPFREILDLLCGELEGRWRAGTIPGEQARRLWQFIPFTAQALVSEGPSLLKFFVSGQSLLKRLNVLTRGDSDWLARLREQIETNEYSPLERDQLLTQFSAFLSALAQRQPFVLILDDLQWADYSSLNLLFHLSRNLVGKAILLLGAYRSSEARSGSPAGGDAGSVHPLNSIIAELKRRYGPVEIKLEGFSPTVGRKFSDALIDTEPNCLDESFRAAFFQHTQGHPLFSVEMLREMQDRGDLFKNVEGAWEAIQDLDWERLPIRTEAAISRRVNRLDKDLLELLAAASVEGETFTVQVLTQTLKRSERWILQRLSRLQKEHRLVHERTEIELAGQRLNQYTFNHFLFQAYLYRQLSQGERRLLHGLVAAALEELYAGHEELVMVSLGQHYHEAGQVEKAISYLLAAGDLARMQNSYQEALGHYQRVLVLLKRQGDLEQAARTLMKIGLTYHNASNFEQAQAANQEAFRLWQQAARSQVTGLLPVAPHALRLAGESFSGKLDPAMVKETPRALLMQQLFSGLMRMGHDLELLPDIARGWEVQDHGRRYVFHLRRDALWTDGVLVTAGDFEYAWKRVLDPATASPNAVNLLDIQGARAYHLGEASSDAVGILALDDHTLQVDLETASPYFPNLLSLEATKPVPQHVVAQHGSSWVAPKNLVTNGPFRLVSYAPGESMVMSRNLDYHGAFSGNVEQAVIALGLGKDRLRHLEMYLAGNLDVLFTFSHLPPGIQKRLRDELASEYRSSPTLAAWLVGFVMNKPPFDDRRVRRAFAMAINRSVLANVIQRGLVTPASGGFLTPMHAAYSEGIALPYDPDQARRLLAEAGYPDGQGLPTIEMVNGHASLSVEASLRYLQAQWRDHLGVDMVWETEWEMDHFLLRLREEPPHLFFIRWAGNHADPDDYLRLESSLVWEIARWHDARYFALVQEARQLADWEQRTALYRQADRELIDKAVILPLVYDRSHFLVKPWVERFNPSAVQRWPFSEIILKPH